MNNRIVIKVANIPISIISNSVPIENINFGEIYKKFIFNENETEINIYVHYGKMPEVSLRDKKLIVGMKNIWKLYRSNKKQIFILNPVSPKRRVVSNIDYIGCKIKLFSLEPIYINSPSHRIGIFEHSFTKGNVYVKLPHLFSSNDNFLNPNLPPLPNPLDMPLSELLMMDWLSNNRQGSLFHGCGVMDSERGYLFLGFSGHGKSTMANLWRNESVILHDDRIVLRKIKGYFWMFATPWYGKDVGTAKGVLLNKIFFIRHGLRNRVYRESKLRAFLMLLSYSFRPLWNRDGIEQNVEFCTQLAQEIPCFILDFIPDIKVVDYIMNLR